MHARNVMLDYMHVHFAQNTDKLETVKKISRAKSAEVHKLQSEYIQSNTQSLGKGYC